MREEKYTAIKIYQELKYIMDKGIPFCDIHFNDYVNKLDYMHCFNGPYNTPYENGLFPVKLYYPIDYPKSPPKIQFLVPIYHPNIYNKNDGKMPLGTYYLPNMKNWDPNVKIMDILTNISSVFTTFDLDNSNRIMDEDIKNEIINNKDLFVKKAKYFTFKYANVQNNFKKDRTFWDFSYNDYY